MLGECYSLKILLFSYLEVQIAAMNTPSPKAVLFQTGLKASLIQRRFSLLKEKLHLT